MSMLLFGAGASRPFGIPTMQEMVDDFEKNLSQSTVHFKFYQTIKKSLVEQYGTIKIDIEAMLSVLQGIAERVKPSDLGHFTYYYITKNCSKNSFSEEEIVIAKELVLKLKEYIKTKCRMPSNSTDGSKIYEKSYLPLFQNLQGKKSNYHGKYELTIAWKSFTTNYDDIFERFWSNFHEPATHFERQGTSNNYIFNSNLTLGNQSFSKLHGSLDWTRIKETDQIFRSSLSGFNTFETEGDVMLYPIQQKDLYLHPWFTLFQDFKNALLAHDRWYVIGYAFNDEFIFNVIKEGLTKKSKTMIIIDPNAESIRRKFPDNLQKQIIALSCHFGDQYFANNFKDFANNRRNIVISIQTNASYLQLEFPFPILTEHDRQIQHGQCIRSETLPNNKAILEYRTDTIGQGIMIDMNVDVGFDYTNNGLLDFKFITNSKVDVKMTMKNQERIIDICTIHVQETTDNTVFRHIRKINSSNFLK